MKRMYSVTEYLHLNTDYSLTCFLSNVFRSLSVAFSRLLYGCLRIYLYVVLCIYGISFHVDQHRLSVLLFCSIRLSDTPLVRPSLESTSRCAGLQNEVLHTSLWSTIP